MNARHVGLAAIPLAVSGALLGCASHPDSLHLDLIRIEFVESQAIYPTRARGQKALGVVFEGRAPFAAIKAEGKMAQFRCQLFDDSNRSLAEMAFGRTYVVAPLAKPDPVTDETPMDDDGVADARHRYRSIVYPGLKEQSKVNGPFDFDLRHDDYHHIGCQLVGVQMFGPFIWSNELVISRSEVHALLAASVGKE